MPVVLVEIVIVRQKKVLQELDLKPVKRENLYTPFEQLQRPVAHVLKINSKTLLFKAIAAIQ